MRIVCAKVGALLAHEVRGSGWIIDSRYEWHCCGCCSVLRSRHGESTNIWKCQGPDTIGALILRSIQRLVARLLSTMVVLDRIRPIEEIGHPLRPSPGDVSSYFLNKRGTVRIEQFFPW